MPRRRDIELLKELGARLRTLRSSRGYTQEQLGEVAELKPTTISEVERGNTSISISNWASIADVLGVDLSEMFALGREPPPPSVDPGEEEVVRIWRSLEPPGRDLATRLLRELAREETRSSRE